jgi:hypothetical protein
MTLSELATVANPVYEIRVRSDQKREWLTLPIGSDLSDHPESYNMFEVDIDLLGFDFGDYEYQAWQVNTGEEKIVEVGKMRYHRETVEPDQFANPNEDNFVYAPS